MAAANEKATYTVTRKFKLGESVYGYVGTIALGSEYKTGGNSLVSVSEGRYELPEKIDFMFINPTAGWTLEYTEGKVKVFGGAAAEKVVAKEAGSGVSLTAVAAAQFYCVGR